MKNRIFPFIIAFSALSVSLSAAFYSVTGLSKLFAGASFEVLIMASSLEVSKLVIASLLYQYWHQLNKLLRTYLVLACTILILITSIGIYGFLSAAYQQTAASAGNVDKQIELVEIKRNNINQQLTVYNAEKTDISAAITELRSGISRNVVQYTDARGNQVTTTSSANRKALERQLDQTTQRQSVLNTKIDSLNTILFDYETQITDLKINGDTAGELGPLKYLSGLTGVAMDKIINVLLLIIIFVFDPLAISLVIAANFAFAQLKKKEDIVADKEKRHTALVEIMQTDEDNGLYDDEPAVTDNVVTEADVDSAVDVITDDDRSWLETMARKDQESAKKIKDRYRNSYWAQH